MTQGTLFKPIEPTVSQILVIEMWRPECDCTICDASTSDRFSIPIWEDTIVTDEYEGAWGGSPVCKSCYEVIRNWQEENPGKFCTFGTIRHLIESNHARSGVSK